MNSREIANNRLLRDFDELCEELKVERPPLITRFTNQSPFPSARELAMMLIRRELEWSSYLENKTSIRPWNEVKGDPK